MLTSVLAAISISVSIAWALLILKRNPFHPAIFFLLFASTDVFFPAIYWTLFGQVNNPDWLPLLTDEKILVALIYYSSFFFIFVSCLLAAGGPVKPQLENAALSANLRKKLSAVLWILLLLTFAQLVSEIVSYGGAEAWFWSRFVIAAVADRDGAAASGEGLLAALPLRALFQAAVGLAFFYRQQLKMPWLFTYLFPALALILAMATFLRGTVLTCAITLIFADVMRSKISRRTSPNAKCSRRPLRTLGMLVIAGMLIIYVYGAVRDGFRGIASGTEGTGMELALPTFLTAGSGLLGVSHIVAEYGQSVDFLWGKTYFDMMLLPIPRSIYTSKPAWYGIDDITRGMGWPESTQSAVTMPGEAFANFGYFGLLVAVLLGVAFGLLQRFVRSNINRFLLLAPILFFQVASVTNWMAFTGVMNAVPLLALLILLAAFLNKGSSRMSNIRPYELEPTGP